MIVLRCMLSTKPTPPSQQIRCVPDTIAQCKRGPVVRPSGACTSTSRTRTDTASHWRGESSTNTRRRSLPVTARSDWPLRGEPNNTLALKTGGRAALGLGDYARARALLEGAKTKEPNDKQVLAALDELARKTSTTATASAAP